MSASKISHGADCREEQSALALWPCARPERQDAHERPAQRRPLLPRTRGNSQRTIVAAKAQRVRQRHLLLVALEGSKRHVHATLGVDLARARRGRHAIVRHRKRAHDGLKGASRAKRQQPGFRIGTSFPNGGRRNSKLNVSEQGLSRSRLPRRAKRIGLMAMREA